MLNAGTMLCRTFPDHDLIEHKNTVFAWENLDCMAKRYCYNPENLGSIQQKDAMLLFHPENGNLVFKVCCVGTSSDTHPAFLFELQRLFCLLAGWLSRLIFQWLQSPAGSWFTYINAEFCGTAKAYEVKVHFGEPQSVLSESQQVSFPYITESCFSDEIWNKIQRTSVPLLPDLMRIFSSSPIPWVFLEFLRD